MNRLYFAGLVSLALAAGVVAAPPTVPPTVPPTAPPSSRFRMPSTPIRPVTPVRPPVGVFVVPTTPAPRPYAPYFAPSWTMPHQHSHAVYYRSGPLMPWSYYGTYSSFWMAEMIGLELEYYYGVQAWVR